MGLVHIQTGITSKFFSVKRWFLMLTGSSIPIYQPQHDNNPVATQFGLGSLVDVHSITSSSIIIYLLKLTYYLLF